MTYSVSPIGMLMFVVFSLMPSPQTVSVKDLKGKWLGTLKVNGLELRLMINISEQSGKEVVTIDSLDQNAYGIPSNINIKDDQITINVPSIRARFEGKLEGDTLDGAWIQGGELPLTLKKTTKEFQRKRPQEPTEPFPYSSREVQFPNRKANISLSGTFTHPKGDGPYPTVILISGSGPQDRDESLMGHKPFLVLSDHLTRKGIAVLRYDERGVGKSTGSFSGATSRDFADDVSAAVDFLLTQKEVNKDQIGLVGHSEGGLIAPMVAAERSDVAMIALLAGPGLTGAEVLYQQGALIGKANGWNDEQLTNLRKRQETVFSILLSEKNENLAQFKLVEAIKKTTAASTELSEEALQREARQMNNAWFRYFLAHDPAKTLATLDCPVLAINGSKDLQVPAKENLNAIESALKQAGNKSYKVVELPGLNHLFQSTSTGAPSEYGRIEETFAPVALETISDWLLAQTQNTK